MVPPPPPPPGLGPAHPQQPGHSQQQQQQQQMQMAFELQGKKRPRESSTPVPGVGGDAAASAADLLLMDMKSVGSFYYENFAFPAGMVPYKRPAADKSGVPVYQPNATTYQQLMQLQQPFVPVSCEYPSSPGTPNANAASVTTMANTAAPPPPQHPPPSASASPPLQQPAPPLTPKEEPQQQQQQQQYQQQLQQVPPPPPPSHSAPPPMLHDPAALAKEVAQQNYAKAIKLAAMNQQLNPLNYTGVSLNKQMVAAAAQPSPAAYPRYPATLPFQFQAGGLSPLGLANPYQAALAQQNLLNLRSQAQPNFQINPYSLIRPQYMTAAAAAPAQYQLLQQQAQYPVAVSAAPMTTATPSGSIAVAAAQNNNNNVVLQPYKKLKTT
ncbi:unnamed protein product [Callosobruchus maculatus]|uniref:Uncharacterized protein n=1 Tax=Callosobruchus maculatus TaxID=64391 RepID=A0A653BVT9_CALMS|nr:unnamed protein product [Callosobruchus maculatus]